ncbi:MAG TPA: tRNA (adenosine(37)-N6)-threonylcarbamoyltransferase complex dimerization subunit type 1 TsaB [Cyclobacteriaceae bacterium]|nr:tRNA (adenosine(37)-N6)-threonylcarbamoyltransferase complex dimerization subunit type 1 TsaB [Cyclobacteriaceae bacterium]HRK55768.1 tRNA (adenosine(37)-N6)-threonylcarbamoyltransferase complex dimerization subunit type 1 TsaB [Cyclobacteriaceae bacterium]
MSLILSLETASAVCSVALHDDGIIKASSHLFISQSASSQLAVMVDELLKRCDLKPNQLNAVAVSEGPGSYTGLRIGVASAKGLCYALDIPLIAVNTLESMVQKIATQFSDEIILCPMLDARRMEVYCLLANNKGDVLEPTQAKVMDETSFEEVLSKNKVVFFGNGAAKCKEVITNANAIFLSDITPSAEQIGELAFKKFQTQQFEDLANFEPFYLKDFLIKKPKSAF